MKVLRWIPLQAPSLSILSRPARSTAQSNARKVKGRAQKACCCEASVLSGKSGHRIVDVSLSLICRPRRSWQRVCRDMAGKLTLAARLPARLPVRFDKGTQAMTPPPDRLAAGRCWLLSSPLAAALQRGLKGEWRDFNLQGWSRLVSA